MMTPEEAMKRCQTGCTDLQMANNLLAACYGVIGALMGEVGALKVQLNAAKRGMDSAKDAGAKMMAIGKKLAAENSPEAIESEREANAVLTAENEALQTEVERLRGAMVAVSDGANEMVQDIAKILSRVEQERDQLQVILQGVEKSDYRFSVAQLAAHDAEVIERAFVAAYQAGFQYGLKCDQSEIESTNRTASAIRVFDYNLQYAARRAAGKYIRHQANEAQS